MVKPDAPFQSVDEFIKSLQERMSPLEFTHTTNISSSNVVTSNAASINSVTVYENTIGTVVKESTVSISDVGVMSGVTDPDALQDVSTKKYIDTMLLARRALNI